MSALDTASAFPEVRPGEPLTLGHLVGGAERRTGTPIEVRNPGRHDEIVGIVFEGGAAEVDEAVRDAADVADAWAATSPAERERLLREAADLIDAHADRIAELAARENGSALSIVRAETGACAISFRAIADALAGRLEDEVYDGGERGVYVRVERRPYGVVGCIVPWNAPLILTANKLAPALAAGNAVVLKPSPNAPLGVTILARLVASVLPAGVVAVVNGGADAVSALIDDPRVRKLSFTGGGATARIVLARAAAALKPVHLELGGNDPAIVLADADLAATADGIVASAFRRAGQVCFAVKRVYVPRERQAELAELLSERIDRLRVGDALDPTVTMGPLNNAMQYRRIEELAERTAGAGREVRELGQVASPEAWPQGYFLRPRLVPDAASDDELVVEEQFGPILPVVGYADEAEAVAQANATPYGLASSVWSSDPEAAAHIAGRIEAGVTFINSHLFSPAGSRWIPFGGWKQSGMGWEGSPHGIDEYLQFHSVDAQGLARSRA